MSKYVFMKEYFLQYIWFNKLFYSKQYTTEGQSVEIIDTGQLNTDAGADVFNAKVKIGDIVWAGNVEFHIRSSDWQRHGHNTDKAYDAVILHVILEDDGISIRTDGSPVQQLVISYPEHLREEFERFDMDFIYCADKLLASKGKKDLSSLFSKLLDERLANRLLAVEQLLQETSNDWEEAFYITTARSFGFGTNADAFEALAKRLPQKILAKHKDNLTQIEALLFGVGGFFEQSVEDEYFDLLRKEFAFLRQKYRLQPMSVAQWKQFRVRPTNFPTLRIAQFAAIIHRSSRLFSKVIEQKSYRKLVDYYRCTPSEYWTSHYRFGTKSDRIHRNLSKSTIDTLLINSVIPFFYAYGIKFNILEYTDLSRELLKNIPSEKNFITKVFASLGIDSHSAFESQALRELKSRYCNTKSCYICRNKFGLW